MVVVLSPQRSVEEWLRRLELDEYTNLFHAEGYRTEEDVENLKDLTSEELKAIGVHKRGAVAFESCVLDNGFWVQTLYVSSGNIDITMSMTVGRVTSLTLPTDILAMEFIV